MEVSNPRVLLKSSNLKSIFTKRKQVLLVEGVDIAHAVVVDNTVRNDQGLALVDCAESVHGETRTKELVAVDFDKVKPGSRAFVILTNREDK